MPWAWCRMVTITFAVRAEGRDGQLQVELKIGGWRELRAELRRPYDNNSGTVIRSVAGTAVAGQYASPGRNIGGGYACDTGNIADLATDAGEMPQGTARRMCSAARQRDLMHKCRTRRFAGGTGAYVWGSAAT